MSSGTVLWENPNPGVRFTAQTVRLNQKYTDFKVIGVECQRAVGEPDVSETYFKIEGLDTTSPRRVIGAMGTYLNGYFSAREYTLQNENEIYFYYYHTAGNGTVGDSGIIPTRIIGYK